MLGMSSFLGTSFIHRKSHCLQTPTNLRRCLGYKIKDETRSGRAITAPRLRRHLLCDAAAPEAAHVSEPALSRSHRFPLLGFQGAQGRTVLTDLCKEAWSPTDCGIWWPEKWPERGCALSVHWPRLSSPRLSLRAPRRPHSLPPLQVSLLHLHVVSWRCVLPEETQMLTGLSFHAPGTGSLCPAGHNHHWGDLETRILRTHARGGGAQLQAEGQEKGSMFLPGCGSCTQMPRRWSCSLRHLSPSRLGPGWNSTES